MCHSVQRRWEADTTVMIFIFKIDFMNLSCQLPYRWWIHNFSNVGSRLYMGMGGGYQQAPTPLETCCKACWYGKHPPPRDLLQSMLPYHLQGMLGYHPPSCGQTHTCENITFTTSLRTLIVPQGPGVGAAVQNSTM